MRMAVPPTARCAAMPARSCRASAWRRASTGSASAPPRTPQAMECLGGNGCPEESGMPRLYREAPLMGISGKARQRQRWTLRAMATRPECIDVLFDELAKTAGRTRGWTTTSRSSSRSSVTSTPSNTGPARSPRTSAWRCRSSLLVRHGHPAVAGRSWPPGWVENGVAFRHAAHQP